MGHLKLRVRRSLFKMVWIENITCWLLSLLQKILDVKQRRENSEANDLQLDNMILKKIGKLKKVEIYKNTEECKKWVIHEILFFFKLLLKPLNYS